MKELFNSISKKEWHFIWLMAVVVMILTGLPYLLGYLMTPPGTTYDGLHSLSPGDIPIYYSYINQVKEGEIFAKNLFTSEAQDLGTFNVWWTLVGLLARISNLSIILVFQLVRLLLIPVFIFVVYLFIAYFFDSEIKRKVSLFFILFSGGLGFYFAQSLDLFDFSQKQSYWWPIDLWLTEAITFNALYQTSHFIASIILMVLIFLLVVLSFEKRKFSYAVVSGFLALFYFNFHPYYFPVIFGVLGLYLLVLIISARKILWQPIGYLLTAFLISLPSIFYHIWLVQESAIIGQRALQNVTLISPFIFILIGYGFLWLGFILGLWFLIKNKKLDKRFIFLLVWLIVNLALIYSPFPFHSRYTQGLHIILAIFTVAGLFELRDCLKVKLNPKVFDFWINNPALWGMVFLVLLAPSTVYSVGRDIYYFTFQPAEIKTKIYLDNDVLAAMDWLSAQKRGQVVLASEIPAKFIPGFSGQTVYLAHGHETLFFDSKLDYLLWFFADNKNDEGKIRFLGQKGIDYVFYSDYEKNLGEFNPAEKNYLKLVFDSDNAQVYQVVKD